MVGLQARVMPAQAACALPKGGPEPPSQAQVLLTAELGDTPWAHLPECSVCGHGWGTIPRPMFCLPTVFS